MALIMGVDGGGSKTYAVITDAEGNLLGEGLAGGANYQKIGLDRAMDHISTAMKHALEQAGLQYADLDFVQYTLAGADREADMIRLESGLKKIPVTNWNLACDTMAGLRAGSPDNVGIVLVCGSGTNAFGRNRDGQVVQTGGFGYLYGDYAGGNHMAIETFRAAVRSWEQRDIPSILTERVPSYLGYSSMEALLNDYLDRQVRTVPSELTIVLHEAVQDGDALSIRLLSEVGHELGNAARSVMRRIGSFGVDNIPIVLIGSIFQRGKSSCLLQSLEETLREEHTDFTIEIPEMEPVFGAVLMGMDQLQLPAGPQITERLNSYRREIIVES